MKNTCLTHKLTFDLSQLLPGRGVRLISASHMPGEEPRKQTAIIKNVNHFSITLLMVRLGDYEKDNLTGKVEEKEFPVSAFEGVGCYKLVRLYSEEEIIKQQEED